MAMLRIIREPSLIDVTHGALYLDGHWFCWTLEPRIREVPGQPVSTWKVPGATAIPAGIYRVVLEVSPKFNRALPEFTGVPGFSEIKFHAGNTLGDTEGCPLVGYGRRLESLQHSRMAEDDLVRRLGRGDHWCEVTNPRTALAVADA